MNNVIAIDFRTRTRAPIITLSTPSLGQVGITSRQVRAICGAHGIPATEHDRIIQGAVRRLRAGDSAACVHAWARKFCRDLVRALHARGPDDAA
jgi:hypothetical protein